MSLQLNTLVIEKEPTLIKELSEEFTKLDFVVLEAKNNSEAFELIKNFPKTSLIVINKPADPEKTIELVEKVKKSHPNMPIICIEDDRKIQFGAQKPNVTLTTPVNGKEIRAHAEKLLRERFYPDFIVQMIKDSTEKIFKTSFKRDIVPGTPCLKANRFTLAPVTSIISFVGKELSGRIVLSGPDKYLGELYKSFVGTTEEPQIEQILDVCGEISNLIIGDLKNHFVRLGRSFEITSPIFLTGDIIDVRYKSGLPSLVVPFDGDGNQFFVQFCFDRFQNFKKDAESQKPGSVLEETGQVNFL